MIAHSKKAMEQYRSLVAAFFRRRVGKYDQATRGV